VPKRFLITGVDGFIGSWLARSLRERGDEVFGLSRKLEEGFRLRGEITDRAAVETAIRVSQPDCIFHLAAQNNVMESIRNLQETISVNVSGSLNLFRAVRDLSPKSRVISVGSSSEYGETASVHQYLKEAVPLLPSNGYGITKATQGMFASLFARVFGLDTIHVRPFAIVGPGKQGDALADFCQGTVAIERGLKTALTVGNMDAVRDFVDVRDCVSAFLLVCEKGTTGETYNICNRSEASLKDIVGILKRLSKRSIQIEVDPSRMRPADDLRIVGNNRKLKKLGYSSAYDLATTVADTLAYWRINA
jgi:GDP-4-dehydro-6-deoxy-D-mannose reductase